MTKIYQQFLYLLYNMQQSGLLSKRAETKMLNYPLSNPLSLFCNSFSFLMLTNIPTPAYKKEMLDNTTTVLFVFGLMPYSQVPPAIAKYAISFLFTILAFLSIMSIFSFNSMSNYTIKKATR